MVAAAPARPPARSPEADPPAVAALVALLVARGQGPDPELRQGRTMEVRG